VNTILSVSLTSHQEEQEAIDEAWGNATNDARWLTAMHQTIAEPHETPKPDDEKIMAIVYGELTVGETENMVINAQPWLIAHTTLTPAIPPSQSPNWTCLRRMTLWCRLLQTPKRNSMFKPGLWTGGSLLAVMHRFCSLGGGYTRNKYLTAPL
jgi:hypothetical protein